MKKHNKFNGFLKKKIYEHCFDKGISESKFFNYLAEKYNKKHSYVPTRQGISYQLSSGNRMNENLVIILAHELGLERDVVRMSSGHLPENMRLLARSHPQEVLAALQIVADSLLDLKE